MPTPQALVAARCVVPFLLPLPWWLFATIHARHIVALAGGDGGVVRDCHDCGRTVLLTQVRTRI
jgi:hypothetical protein